MGKTNNLSLGSKPRVYENNTNKSTIEPYHKLNAAQIDIAVTLVELGRNLKSSNIAALLNVTEENINQHVRRRKEKKA